MYFRVKLPYHLISFSISNPILIKPGRSFFTRKQSMSSFKIALIQSQIGSNKSENVSQTLGLVKEAAGKGASLVVLPECFNSPYGTQFFPEYAEDVPAGDTCKALSRSAADNKITLVGGSIPERDGDKLFNTCTVWGPEGQLLAKYRKLHLFDIDVPGMRFKESDTLSPGNCFTTFSTDKAKIGLGICYDVRFEELARLYRQKNCDIILYPGAFNMTTGPMHWELLLRGRAVDTQTFVAGIAPARDMSANYKSYGHTMLVSPYGKVLAQAEFDQEIILADVDLEEVRKIREQIPTGLQRRHDLYETIAKIKFD